MSDGTRDMSEKVLTSARQEGFFMGAGLCFLELD